MTSSTFVTAVSVVLLCNAMGAIPMAAQNSSAQQQARFGIFGSWDGTLNSADFTGLPEIPSCCPSYSSTMSSGWRAGLAYIKPVSHELSLHVRMAWEAGTVGFVSLESEPIVSATGQPAEATIRHELTTSASVLSIEPLAGWQPIPGLTLLGGLRVGYRVATTFAQREVLVEPIDGVFRNQSRERNVLNGDIPNARPYAASITLGVSYDLPLTSERTVMLSPELLASISPVGPVSGISWTQHMLRAGVVLSFVPPSINIDPTDQELFETSLVQRQSATGGVASFQPSISLRGLAEDGTESELSELVVEEVVSNRTRPLLPTVFFDANSYEIPSRYYRLTSEQRDQFSMANFYNLDALVTYRHLLNIVGRRMTDNPSSTITVVGFASPDERGGVDLAQERAGAVRDYLTDEWNISADRIRVDGTTGPERVVTLQASSDDLLDNVYSVDTARVTTPAGVRFTMALSPSTPIADWRVLVSRRGVVVHSERGGDPLLRSAAWRPTTRPLAISRGTTELSYLLAVTDSNGVVVPTTVERLPVREVRLSDAGARKVVTTRYSVLFSDAASADLSPSQMEQLEQLRSTIPAGARVRVIGYSNDTTPADVQLNLTQRRANNVAKVLGGMISETRGVGQRLPLYDDGTPEAHHYSRTVEITIEVPQP